jgi:hypothetical protein
MKPAHWNAIFAYKLWIPSDLSHPYQRGSASDCIQEYFSLYFEKIGAIIMVDRILRSG